jgi:1,4-dihydroxy-2-naphthoyl-CoA hydrolase
LFRYISQVPGDLIQFKQFLQSGIENVLGIRLTAIGPDFVCGEMPVDERTQQPFGILHGGASIVLAETLGSWASYLTISDEPGARVAGIEVSGSHLRTVRSGHVTGIARPIRLGRSLHFWRIDILDDDNEIVCAAKLIVKVDRGATRD